MGGFAIKFRPDLIEDTSKPKTILDEKDEDDIPEENGEKLPAVENDKEFEAEDTTTPLVAPSRVQDQTPRRLESQRREEQDNTALRKELRRRLKTHSHHQWFLFKIPEVARGRWEINRTNEALVEGAIEIAKVETLGKHSRDSYMQSLMTLCGNIWVVDGVQLQYPRDAGIIERLPRITEEEIKDRSKEDVLTKLIALLQVSWLWIQLVIRKTYGLPSTQLEIMTAAFATCSSITYLMYLSKPKDVSTRVYINAKKYPTVAQMARLGRLGPTAVWFRRAYVAIGNDNYHQMEGHDTAPALISTCGLVWMIFASVHFACWNPQFPTDVERLGWRIPCVLLLGLPVPICGLMIFKHGLETTHRRDGSRPTLAKILDVVVYMLKLFYVMARMFIIVESGRSLWYLPSKAFVTTWTSNVPHV